MKTYELNLPEEPQMGSVVIDADGWHWRNKGNSFENNWEITKGAAGFLRGKDWFNLLQRGPLTLKESEPEQGAIRTHKSTNTLFVVYVGSEWVCYQLFANGTTARVPDFNLNNYRSNEQIKDELEKEKIKA